MLASPATAGTIQVGSAAALGANDVLDWSRRGRSTPAAMRGAGVAAKRHQQSRAGGQHQRRWRVHGAGRRHRLVRRLQSWRPVLYTGDANDLASWRLRSRSTSHCRRRPRPADRLGGFLDFGASLEIFDGATSLGLFTVSGVTTGAETGRRRFSCRLSDSANITSAVFTLTSNTDFGFGVNRLLTADSEGVSPLRGPLLRARFPNPGHGLSPSAGWTVAQRREPPLALACARRDERGRQRVGAQFWNRVEAPLQRRARSRPPGARACSTSSVATIAPCARKSSPCWTPTRGPPRSCRRRQPRPIQTSCPRGCAKATRRRVPPGAADRVWRHGDGLSRRAGRRRVHAVGRRQGDRRAGRPRGRVAPVPRPSGRFWPRSVIRTSSRSSTAA